MSQWQTGTVDVTNGSSVVTNTGTAWASNANVGDLFAVEGDGVLYVIASVDSDTQVALAANYAGTTGTGCPTRSAGTSHRTRACR